MSARPILEFASLAVLVTARCPFACGHCYTRSSPKRSERAELSWALPAVEAILPHVRSVALTGGEPFLEPEFVEAIARVASLQVPVNVVSSGAFAREPEQARSILDRFRRAGVKLVNLSYDAHHDPFGGLDLIISAARLCADAELPVIVQVTGKASSDPIRRALDTLRDAAIDLFRVDYAPFGRAEVLGSEWFESSPQAPQGGCSNIMSLSLDYEGVLRACCGPTLECGAATAFHLANVRAGDDPRPAVEAATRQRVLAGVAVLGPHELARTLGCGAPVGENICTVCVRLLSDPQKVEALERELSRREQGRRLVAGKLLLEKKFLQAVDAGFAALEQEGIGRG